MATPIAWSKGFPVNSTMLSTQAYIKTVRFDDGSFVAVWTDFNGGNGDFGSIRAQLFNADGTKKGSEFLVNTSVSGMQGRPEVTVLSDGRFVVAWEDHSDTSDLRARIFNADGTAFDRKGDGTGTSDFLLHQVANTGDPAQTDVSITALAGGGFAVSYFNASSGSGVLSQTFDAWGRGLGSPALANSEYRLTDGIGAGSLTVGLGDTYAVLSNKEWSGSKDAIGIRIFTAGGQSSAETHIVGADNELIILTGATRLADGRMIVTWLSRTSSNGSFEYTGKAQILAANGEKSGPEFVLDRGYAPIEMPTSVVALHDGGFAVTYTAARDFGSNDGFDVRISTFNVHGIVTGDTLVRHENDVFAGVEAPPHLTVLADGRLFVSWTGLGASGEPDDFDVFGQIYDARGTSVHLTGTNGDDMYYGTAFNDRLGGGLGNDRLNAGQGKDIISGGYGNDILTGGTGKDYFVFNTTLGNYKTDRQVNFDTIIDFKVKDDTFWLDNAIFKKLGKKGSENKPAKLDKDFFKIATKAKDKNDYLVYDKKKGVLYYDADGSGSKKAVEIAQLSKNLKLTYKDFFVI